MRGMNEHWKFSKLSLTINNLLELTLNFGS